MPNNNTKSAQLGTLEGKDMASEHFGFSPNVLETLIRTMQWQLGCFHTQLWMPGN